MSQNKNNKKNKSNNNNNNNSNTTLIKGENAYYNQVIALSKTLGNAWNDLFTISDPEERQEAWDRLVILGSPLNEKYSWVVPDNRALNIIKYFSPIIEIGAGKGYWAALLKKMGVDIVAFDLIGIKSKEDEEKEKEKKNKKNKNESSDSEDSENSEDNNKFYLELNEEDIDNLTRDSKGRWTEVLYGGSEKLLDMKINKVKGKNQNNNLRTLLLCYPDEFSTLSMDCFKNYDGDYIIHVGELISTGSSVGGWGRSTCSEFQVALMHEFNCILCAKLVSFPFSKDYITVWKRIDWIQGQSTVNMDDDDEEEEEEEDEEEEEEVRSPLKKQKLEKKKEKLDEFDEEVDVVEGESDGYEEDSEDEVEEEDDDEDLYNVEAGNKDDEDDEDDESHPTNLWAAIPSNELLSHEKAIPSLEFLLKK